MTSTPTSSRPCWPTSWPIWPTGIRSGKWSPMQSVQPSGGSRLAWSARRQMRAASEDAADEASLLLPGGPAAAGRMPGRLGPARRTESVSRILRQSTFRAEHEAGRIPCDIIGPRRGIPLLAGPTRGTTDSSGTWLLSRVQPAGIRDGETLVVFSTCCDFSSFDRLGTTPGHS